MARRWRTWPAGRIFPATLGYTTMLLNDETARRVGISPHDQCATALDPALAGPARRDGCRAGLRASYVDQLQGVVYTTGVLAFPSPAKARAFDRGLPPARPPVAGLRALAFPGTAAGRFADDSRQMATARQDGPYVLLTVAGYADGRPAAATGEFNTTAFAAAGQLADAILAPLTRPAVVDCRRPGSGHAEPPCPADRARLSAGRDRCSHWGGGPGQRGRRPGAGGRAAPAAEIEAPAAWRLSQGRGVTVAVLDTGVDAAAPDLTGPVTTGPDYTLGADPPGYQPPHLHGTFIASIIAGHGSGPGRADGIIGVAPAARVLSVRVILDDQEPGLGVYNENPQYADAIATASGMPPGTAPG